MKSFTAKSKFLEKNNFQEIGDFVTDLINTIVWTALVVFMQIKYFVLPSFLCARRKLSKAANREGKKKCMQM